MKLSLALVTHALAIRYCELCAFQSIGPQSDFAQQVSHASLGCGGGGNDEQLIIDQFQS